MASPWPISDHPALCPSSPASSGRPPRVHARPPPPYPPSVPAVQASVRPVPPPHRRPSPDLLTSTTLPYVICYRPSFRLLFRRRAPLTPSSSVSRVPCPRPPTATTTALQVSRETPFPRPLRPSLLRTMSSGCLPAGATR